MANTISGRVSARPFVGPVQWLLVAALLLLSETQVLAGSLALAWDPVNDPRVAGYKVHYGTASGNYTAQRDVGKVTTSTIPNLVDGATYYFAVTVYDGSLVQSGFSNEVVGAVPAAPAGAPLANFTSSTRTGTAPLAMNFTSTSTGSITTYAWAFGDGTNSAAQNPIKTYSSAGTYTVALTVTGPGGTNTKTVPSYITVTAAAPDTMAPSVPSGLTGTAPGSTSVSLSWSASTDNVGVTGYRVERCQGASCTNFAQVGAPTGTTFSNTGLTAGTTYRYRVRAIDAAGNLGAYSAIVAATTLSAPPSVSDTTPPTVPSGLTGTATGSTSISVRWTASTDNVGVGGYRVYRCQGMNCTAFGHVATTTGTTFSNTGLVTSATYRYQVRAFDAAGNFSAYSTIVTTTTLSGSPAGSDTTPPGVPSGLTGTATGSTGISLRWNASTDNIGVTGYRVERCQGTSCTNFAQIATPTGTTFSDTGRTASTAYRYRVRAVDAGGNLSAYSTIVNVLTPVAAASGDVTSNLVGHWMLNDGFGTTARDSAGNHPGTLGNGPTWVPGKSGQAVSFDGVDDFIDLGILDISGSALTIAAWIKADSFATNDARILSKSMGSAEQDHYFMLSTFESGGSKLRFRLKTGTTTSTLVASSGVLATGQWIHVAAVYNGSAMILYKDGVEVGRLAKTGVVAINATTKVAIGRNPQAYGAFDGAIDDVRVYQRALSASEVLVLKGMN